MNAVLFAGNHQSRFRRGQDGLLVQGLNGVHVDHGNFDSPAGKQPGRLQGGIHHFAAGDYRRVLPPAQEIGLPRLKGAILPVNLRHRAPAHAHIGGLSGRGQIPGQRLGLPGVRRQKYLQIRNGPHQGHVLHRVMGAPQGPVADAAGHADDLHIPVAIGHVHLHLLGAAGGVKAGGAADEGGDSLQRQSRGHAHRVLFRNAAFHKLFRQFPGEIRQRHAAPAVGGQRPDVFVFPGQGNQRLRKRLSYRLHAQSTPFTPRAR